MIEVMTQRADDIGWTPDDSQFDAWAQAALVGHRKSAEISLRLVDEAEGLELNKMYRGKEYATNVLSFPADLPEELNLPLLGDIVICVPVAKKESQEQNKSLSNHWAHLFIHGVYHLIGMDHIDDDEAEQMEAAEVKALSQLSVENPYV